jgi:alkylated DNA repair dioxygenase AlkB
MDIAQPDLFAPALPGLGFGEAIVDATEERALIALIDAAGLEPFRFQRWTGKRLTRSFGWSYDFEHGRFAATEPMPDALLPLRRRAAAFAGLDPEDLVQLLLIRYDPGASIGWHRDRPVFEHVVGISLGTAAGLRLRRRVGEGFQRMSVPLPPRSIYHLSGEARHGWEHSIEALEATRWSITFRTLSAAGRAKLNGGRMGRN